VYGSPGTLYSQCGGIFGVSAFVDKCMDKWMADPTLNANPAIRTWHETAQRPGFKFLVVQIVCNLTGGPQLYTGRPMDEAHKHLNISEEQWDKFMELFNSVCEDEHLPDEVSMDLTVLMISMEEDCVVHPGQQVPPNPGPTRPRGNSLYARLGGVYPVALFVDRLVDALLADDRIHIPCDGHKRNEASLKYLFTELVCSITGGPEVRTAPEFDETKLLLPKSEWQILVASASTAGDHLADNLRAELVQALQRAREGIVDPASSAIVEAGADMRAAQVKDLRSAAAGVGLATAARARRAQGVGASVAARRRVFGDPRTLYGRGGGVFGLAKLTDRLMETWMSDSELNANASVARWHESQQKSGFKFLVTQLMGYLTGGPQRYTGQSMEAAHKHLAISPEQWESFMRGTHRVLQEFQLDAGIQRELVAIVQGFQQQCIVRPGESAPADPGLCRRRPPGSNSYAHLGGVYPIALFVDRLVEAVVKGDRVLVQWDEVHSRGSRHPPGLKYMVTELLCNSLGGPELVTSKGFEEAKLGIQPAEWDAFLALAAEVAQVWPTQRHRDLVLEAVQREKVHICVGLVAEDDQSAARQALSEAGFGVIEMAAALDQCEGDAQKALELLRTGWTPEVRMVRTNSGSSLASMETSGAMGSTGALPAAAAASRCPFSGQAAGSSHLAAAAQGRAVPAAAADPIGEAAQVLSECGSSEEEICELLGLDQAAVRTALAYDRYANAARVLKKKKVPLEVIAEKLQMSDARVHTAVQSGAAHELMQGRVLGNSMQEQLDKLLNEDAEMCCPVSLVLFRIPVIASDGFMYEEDSAKALVRQNQASPMTREPLQQQCIPARQKRSEVMTFREKRSDELLDFAKEALEAQPAMTRAALERVTEYLEVLKPSSAPGLARRAAALYERVGSPVPPILRPHLGFE